MKRREFKIEGEKFSVSDKMSYQDYEPKYTIEVLGETFGWTKIGQCNTIAEGKEIAQDWYDYHKHMGDL